jgi:hypothetical protein
VASPRFAIGRSIWGQPIAGHNQGNTAAGQAAGQIASRYVDFARWDCAASGAALARDAGRHADHRCQILAGRRPEVACHAPCSP